MPPKSSKATRPLLFYQVLIEETIDKPIGDIEARFVHEKELKTDHVQWLLGHDENAPRSVGISPAYSKLGDLRALACALDTRVLIINFHSTRPYPDGCVGCAAGSGTQVLNVERRNLLEKELLCHPRCTIYAFDLATLALSLHLHFHLRVANAVDIQSALRIPDRSVMDSVQVVIDDPSRIVSENITRAFENMRYQSSEQKDLTDIVQRSWLCGYIGQYEAEAIREMFDKAPRVDMTKLSRDELNVLQKWAYDMLRKDNLKPQFVTPEIEPEWDTKKQKVNLQSQRYADRITRHSSSVKATVAYDSLTSYSLPGNVTNVCGTSALLEVNHNLEGKEITEVISYGKDFTKAELDLGDIILSMLQGTLCLLDNYWMKAIWLPSEPSESFTPPSNDLTIEIMAHSNGSINFSQCSAITKILSSSFDTKISLVQGPPGTGKTTVIATYVKSAIYAGQRGIWLMAQSNVAVKNIAEKLAKLGFLNFKLLVSFEFYHQWHEHLYEEIKNNIIISDRFPKPSALQKTLQGAQVILCTLGMISNPKLQVLAQEVPITNVIIDEASQIEVAQYVPLLNSYGKTLQKMCFVGDDKQLPPHGQDELENLQSIFEFAHLRESLTFLDTQYRMPPQIGDFISHHVYEGELQSYSGHVVPSTATTCRFIDVNGSEKRREKGTSIFNPEEVKAVVLLARHLQEKNVSYRIITPYDAQRNEIKRALREKDLKWQDKCFNVDSFQGNEDHVIIISVVRSKELGFLSNMCRTNVMLTRCQRAMYIVSSRAFLEGKGANSLVGKMAAELGKQPGAWLAYKDLKDGRFGNSVGDHIEQANGRVARRASESART